MKVVVLVKEKPIDEKLRSEILRDAIEMLEKDGIGRFSIDKLDF